MFGKLLGNKIGNSQASMWTTKLGQDEKAICAFSEDSKKLIIVSYEQNYREVPFSEANKGEIKES